MFDFMQMLRQRFGQQQLPQMMGQPGPQMVNMGQHFGEFSDALAAQPGNQMRGGNLWMLQNRMREQAGPMGAQTFPASPPPQIQAQPLGTVPQQALDLGRYGGLFGLPGLAQEKIGPIGLPALALREAGLPQIGPMGLLGLLGGASR